MDHIFAVLRRIVFCWLISVTATAFGQIGGSGVFSVLKMPANGRTSAWGGYAPAYIHADASFLSNNPALLQASTVNTAVANFNTQFPGIWSGNAAYGGEMKKLGYYGASVSFINYGTMKAYDAGGNQEGNVAANETSISFGMARPLKSNFSYGASVKMAYSILAGYVANGVAFDAGAVYHSSDSVVSAGFVLRNMGFLLQHYLNGQREQLPFQAELGVNIKPSHMPFRFNIVAHDLQKWDLTYNQYLKSNSIDFSGQSAQSSPAGVGEKLMRHFSFGTELVLGKGFGILVGYNHQRRKELAPEALTKVTGYSWGLYLKISKFNITYSSAAYFPGYNMNLFTFSARLSDFKKKSASSHPSGGKG